MYSLHFHNNARKSDFTLNKIKMKLKRIKQLSVNQALWSGSAYSTDMKHQADGWSLERMSVRRRSELNTASAQTYY